MISLPDLDAVLHVTYHSTIGHRVTALDRRLMDRACLERHVPMLPPRKQAAPLCGWRWRSTGTRTALVRMVRCVSEWPADPHHDWPQHFVNGDFVRLADGRPALRAQR